MYGIRGTEVDIRRTDQKERVRREFLLLLVAILPLQVIYPVLSGGPAERPAMVLFFSLILIAGVWIMRGSRRRFLMAAILTLVSLELLWTSLWSAAASLLPFGEFFFFFVLIILTGRNVSTFIRTDMMLPDLLLATTSLFLLTGTALGLGLYLVNGLYPVSAISGMGNIGLSGYLAAGISILTTNGTGMIIFGQSPPLVMVVTQLGMIGGVLLIIFTIGKIVAVLVKKEAFDE
ncbi:MAG: hypothetical protein V1862_12955 [Methanobacteriota archaeon]